MNSVNKTLYIPLYGKALVSKKGIILSDKKAEEIWENEKFSLKGKSKSKWLAYFMAMRSSVFDKWVIDKIASTQDAIVLHLGCGLDSRIIRTKNLKFKWFDIDFNSVINERRKYFNETPYYSMIPSDVRDGSFINLLPNANYAIVVLEGISMYLTNEELNNIFIKLSEKFSKLSILMDCYTPFAVKMTKLKNPIKYVGVKSVYGIKSPKILEEKTGISFKKEHDMTPTNLINELTGCEKGIFKQVYAGKTSKKLYKIYEYEKG